MAFFHSPRLVTSGSIYYLDAANFKCYGASSTVAKSLIPVRTGITSASVFGGTTFETTDGGRWAFNGTSNFMTTENLAPYVTSSTVESVFTWFNPASDGVIVSELGQPTINTGWLDSQIDLDVNGVVRFAVWGGYSNIVIGPALTWNLWYNLGFVYDGSALTGYVNGKSIGSQTYARSAPWLNAFQLHYGLCAASTTGMGSTGWGDGKMATFLVYSRPLSAAEVLQNYEAQRNRFGRNLL